MTDPPVPADPVPEAEPAPVAEPRAAPAHGARNPVAVLTALGFLLVLVGLAFVWQRLQALPESVDPARVAALEAQFAGIQQRLARLEQRPAAAAPDLGAIQDRLAALERRPPPAATDADPSQEKLAALEQRVTQDEARAAQLADRATRAIRLQQATAALAAGQPLGDLPAAPPALARFAAEAPPTEAALRLQFPDAAARAAEASRPATEAQSLAERMWLHVQSMVTVREGGKVILGAPAKQILAAAQEKLDAGDLAGAVQALDALDGPAARAMADWRARAESLLAARAALAAMARG